MQWEKLKERRQFWGQKWLIGGDFNEIIGLADKNGGKERSVSSFWPFRNFVNEMKMEEVLFKGRRWTWANNRVLRVEGGLGLIIGWGRVSLNQGSICSWFN